MKRPRVSSPAGYETSDITPRDIGYAALSLFAGIALSAALVGGLLAVLAHSRQKPAATALESTLLSPPSPRLEIDGKADGAGIQADANRKLEGYAWMDRSAGIARIPIARAMQILAARGWPDASQGTGAP